MTIVAPTLSLDFVNTNQLDPRVTFSRASTATRVNAKGVLEVVGAGVPRFNYDAVDVPILGPELVVNGAFDSNAGGWVTSNGVPTWSAGSLGLVSPAGALGNGGVYQTIATVIGKSYAVQGTLLNVAPTANLVIGLGASGGQNYDAAWRAGSRQVSDTFTATATTTYVSLLTPPNSGSATFDNISVKEITGYSSIAGRCRGLLIEEQRTNLVLHSENMAGASWTKGSNLTANGISGTLMGLPAWSFTSLASNDSYLLQGFSVTVGVTYTATYLTDSVDAARMYVRSNGAYSVCNPTISLVSPGVYKATFVFTVAAGVTSVELHIGPVDSSPGTTFRATAAQLEQGPFATSYVPTSGAAATRAADIATVANAGAWYNQSEGALVTHLDFIAPIATNHWCGGSSLDDGTHKNSIRFWADPTGAIFVQRRLDDVPAETGLSPMFTAGSPVKVGLSYSAIKFNVCARGAVVADIAILGAPTVSRLSLSGVWPTNGHYRSVVYFPLKPTDAELRDLTK